MFLLKKLLKFDNPFSSYNQKCLGCFLRHSVYSLLWVYDITEENVQQKNGPAESYNPWPGYMFTGKLRPFPVVSVVEMKIRCVDITP